MNNFKDILYEVRDGICTITLNRPDRLNATTDLTQREVRQATELADADAAVKVIVLTGAGRGFCAGADMATLDGLPPEDILRTDVTRPFDMNRRSDYQSRFSFFPAVSKPMIAAINGACAGLGMVYAMYCDVRFASDKAVFSTAFSRRGLIAEHGTSWMLPMIVGHAHAIDILLSARKFDAAEALRMNFVNRLYPAEQLMGSVHAYATDLAQNVSPRSMRVIKRQQYEVPFQTLAEALVTANREMLDSTRSDDFREGVAHYVEKRKARFTGN